MSCLAHAILPPCFPLHLQKKKILCSWAAYIVGAMIVLMHELQAEFKEGISLLVSSEVPDGKGVSSSAALEVASMSAISHAYNLEIQPSLLASLCQKVRHYIFLVVLSLTTVKI